MFLRLHYGLTRCHNFQFEKHVSEILSRPFHYSSFSRIVSSHNEDVFSNKTVLCCGGRRKTDTDIRRRAVFIQEPRKFSPIDSNDHQTDSKASKIAGFSPWHRAGNWLEWTTGSVVLYEKWCHIINYLLTSLARDRTEEYSPSVVFVRTSLRSVRTATTSGQYSPVRPSRSVSKKLLLLQNKKNN